MASRLRNRFSAARTARSQRARRRPGTGWLKALRRPTYLVLRWENSGAGVLNGQDVFFRVGVVCAALLAQFLQEELGGQRGFLMEKLEKRIFELAGHL